MESATIVLFGATGDLAKRKIYPALYNLFLDQKLPPSFSLIGLGRREWSNEAFQAKVEQSLRKFSRRDLQDSASMKPFLDAFRYHVLDIDQQEDYQKLLQLVQQREEELHLPQNRLFYLSVGPELFPTIAANIQGSGLGSVNGWKRLVIEKPFGHDLQSARELNEQLSRSFAEEEVFRIDHYLGKPMVQKLEALQQNNPIVQALWSNRYIANVQITANETVGVESRAGYYDQAGAVRDMFQNHLLQLLMMIAIHLPHKSGAEMIRFKKKMVMEALEPLHKEKVKLNVVRGQYKEGSVQGKEVVGYRSEPGIHPSSMNDTFIAARLEMDGALWRGVLFYIRTGKRMKEKSTRIVIEFKEPIKYSPQRKDDGSVPNLLVFEMSPGEAITLQLNEKDSEHKGRFKPVHIDLHASGDDVPEAYENLIHNALNGDSTFFAHWDEVELSWQWVQPILEAFEENLVPLHLYEAGTYGPPESDALLAEDGYHWWLDDKDEQVSHTRGEEQYANHTNH
ncbi:glucose-6-phosphate dehydrogenase [Paenibacillus sp. GCM10023252]|uniref:glucose-6-phosphate dehydrogenase n=1 Tax=Paenibacillus sp. GCM10023252 TaxID=3252649 RepID=UPI003611D111